MYECIKTEPCYIPNDQSTNDFSITPHGNLGIMRSGCGLWLTILGKNVLFSTEAVGYYDTRNALNYYLRTSYLPVPVLRANVTNNQDEIYVYLLTKYCLFLAIHIVPFPVICLILKVMCRTKWRTYHHISLSIWIESSPLSFSHKN